jgi:hypothetical protein
LSHIIGEPGINRKVSLYRKNYIRLLNKAVREYQESRGYILKEIAEMKRPQKVMQKTGRFIYPFDFTDHIETCIKAIARLFKLLDRISSENDTPLMPNEPIEQLKIYSKPVTDIRNYVEHIDKEINRGELEQGRPIMLAVNETDDGVYISKYQISFKDIESVLMTMHEVARCILETKKS